LKRLGEGLFQPCQRFVLSGCDVDSQRTAAQSRQDAEVSQRLSRFDHAEAEPSSRNGDVVPRVAADLEEDTVIRTALVQLPGGVQEPRPETHAGRDAGSGTDGFADAPEGGQGIGVAEQPGSYGFAVLLGYLGVVTFVMVRQGLRVLATRRAPEKLRTPAHEALAWASISGSVIAVGFALAVWSEVSPVLLGMSPIGLVTGRRMLRLMRDPGGQRMGWFYSHMASMLGAGIAFHTAFIVFGAQRLRAYEIEGPLAIVPWILPTVVGVPAIVIWTRRYRRKFGRRAGAAA